MTATDGTGDANHPLDPLAHLLGDDLDTGVFDSGDFADVPAPTHWPSLPSADAPAEWNQLRAWVEQLQRRFAHLDHHVIPRCWWRHNDHVEALAALRDHERSSYAPTAPATAPADWFRALRDITALLKTRTADLGCGTAHTTPPTPLRPVDDRDWDRFVTTDMDRRADAEIGRAAQ